MKNSYYLTKTRNTYAYFLICEKYSNITNTKPDSKEKNMQMNDINFVLFCVCVYFFCFFCKMVRSPPDCVINSTRPGRQRPQPSQNYTTLREQALTQTICSAVFLWTVNPLQHEIVVKKTLILLGANKDTGYFVSLLMVERIKIKRSSCSGMTPALKKGG